MAKLFYTPKELKERIELISMLAFEAGRTYENRVVTFKMYETVNFNDLQYSAAKGGQLPQFSNNSDSMLRMFPQLNERQVDALQDIHNRLDNAVNLILRY